MRRIDRAARRRRVRGEPRVGQPLQQDGVPRARVGVDVRHGRAALAAAETGRVVRQVARLAARIRLARRQPQRRIEIGAGRFRVLLRADHVEGRVARSPRRLVVIRQDDVRRRHAGPGRAGVIGDDDLQVEVADRVAEGVARGPQVGGVKAGLLLGDQDPVHGVFRALRVGPLQDGRGAVEVAGDVRVLLARLGQRVEQFEPEVELIALLGAERRLVLALHVLHFRVDFVQHQLGQLGAEDVVVAIILRPAIERRRDIVLVDVVDNVDGKLSQVAAGRCTDPASLSCWRRGSRR